MKLYGISGLGADERVFQYLKLNTEFIPIQWIKPLKNEQIKQYSLRLAKKIDTKEPFGILGLSFGGLVAVEISKKLKPKLTILISTAETKYELKDVYKLIGKSGLVNFIPQNFFLPPKFIANWFFGSKNKKLLYEIINDTDLSFSKWAVKELLNWDNSEILKNDVLKIGGTKDKLIPQKEKNNVILIQDGTHFMIVDKADMVSKIINKKIKQ